MNGVILGYDDDGDHVPELGVKGVHEHVQPLWEDTKIRTQSTKSALCDRLISTEMLLYLSTSDLRYFLKSVLYFFSLEYAFSNLFQIDSQFGQLYVVPLV